MGDTFVVRYRCVKLVALHLILIAICSSISLMWPLAAQASLHQYPEANGQVMVRSQQSLRDDRGQAWQVIFFKRGGDQQSSVNLRLVGFPGSGAIQPGQALRLSNAGLAWIAPPTSEAALDRVPNVAQYDLKALLPALDTNPTLKLEIPIQGGRPVTLTLPPFVTQEWRTLLAQP